MAKAKRTLIEKNITKYIQNNFDKKDRKRDTSLHFEWFVNAMHIWHEASQAYNSNVKIGKDIGLGTSQGSDAFYVSVNNGERLFTLKDNIDDIILYIKSNGKILTFNFIQTKLTTNISWTNFLNLIDIPLKIWNGGEFDKSQPFLVKVQEFIDAITDQDDEKLGALEHKIAVHFYTNKNEIEIKSLYSDWKTNIDNKKRELQTYFSSQNILIEFRGSEFVNEVYEKMNSNEYKLLIDKSRVIQAEESKYLIGYITAKELLDAIAPRTGDGTRNLHPDVFKNNIRLYLGQNEINQKIEQTLIEDPKKFHYYNNGLTITTKEIKDENTRNYLISPVNIVNGCQTTNSIYNVHRSENFIESEIKIPIRIIVAQDEEYENITMRTNTQNGVALKELLSINYIQKELQEEFNKLLLCEKTFIYKRQKGENIEGDADYIIQIDDILRAIFSTLMLIPDKVSGYFDKTTLKYIDKVFDERFVKLYLHLTALLKLVEDFIEDNYPTYNRLKYHILYLTYRIISKEQDYRKIEEYFKTSEELSSEDIEEQGRIINFINSSLYDILKRNNGIKLVVEYIIAVINEKYPKLVEISNKQDEKILYKAVEKLKRIRTTPVFDSFDKDFTKQINEILNDDETNK